jgi:hypothetical protein
MNMEQIQPKITAEWARTQSQNVMSEKAKLQLNYILAKIEDSALKNERHAYASSIDEIVKKELARRGFSVEYHDVSSIDPRETSYYTIKW